MSADMIKNTSAVSGAKKTIKGEISVADTLRLGDNMSSVKDILFSNETVSVKSSQVYLGTFTVRGEVDVHILYMGENEEPAYLKSVIPFEYIGESASETSTTLYVKSDIRSCEISPMKQRRVDVNIVLGIEGICVDEITVDSLRDISGIDNVMMQKEQLSASLLKSVSSTQSYNFSFDAGAVNPGKILYGSGTLTNVATTSSHAGILVNGMMKTDVIYSVEDEEGVAGYRSFSETFAVNHIIETDSSFEYDRYDVDAYLSCDDIQFLYSDSGLMVGVEASIYCTALLYKDIQWASVVDLYSPNVMLTPVSTQKNCIKASQIASETVSAADTVRLTASSVFKIAATKEKLNLAYAMEEGSYIVNGDLICDVAVLKDEKGAFDTYQLKIPVEWGITNCSFSEDDILVSTKIEECTYELHSDGIYIKANINMSATILEDITVSEITDVTTAEYAVEEENYISIKVHYYQPGEKLWNVAKQNRTTPKQILAMNAIDKEEDIKAYQPLIIK